jgi:hypothetical protein
MDKFASQLTLKTKVVPAMLLNEAGIIGSALSVRANRDEIMDWYKSLKN